ncbi:head decoration protein [Xanthobacter sediminis]
MVAPVLKITAPRILSDLVLWEEDLAYSRETSGPVAAATVTEIGTLIAKDEDGKTVPLPNDGSLACWGVAIVARRAATVDTNDDLLCIRRVAILKDTGILWPAGISAANKAKALGELDARGVLARPAL